MKRYWIVRGFDGTSQLFERKLVRGHYRGAAIEKLLVALASQQLQLDELLGACAIVGAPQRNELLAVRRDDHGNMTIGQNPHYLARQIEE
jgi:hypothetical protein